MTREDELYADELRDRAYSDYERLDLAINELERQTNTRSQRKVRNQMKIMIDIDKDVYTRLFDNGIQDNEIAVDDVCEMARALRLGTPLQALEQQPCEDCISREAVLEHICEAKECYKKECKGRILKRCPDLQWVFDLPSVTPERPKGKWIKCKSRFGTEYFKCSECGRKLNWIDSDDNYCNSCGSDNSESTKELYKAKLAEIKGEC